MKTLWRLRDFVVRMTGVVNAAGGDEVVMLREAGKLLGELIAHDDWLPEAFAVPHHAHPQEYLLYCDPLERFSVVSFVLGPGQKMQVHDHTVWCLVGVLRGVERLDEYRHEGVGVPMQKTAEYMAPAGEIEAVSPTVGDIHAIANALHDQVSVSIHVFGANIGAIKRHRFLLPTGETQAYVSGYANSVLPNFWGPLDGVSSGPPGGSGAGLNDNAPQLF